MKHRYFAVFILLLFLYSCGNNSNRFKIDIADNNAFKIHRFDSDFILLDTTNIEFGIKKLYQKYPKFMPIVENEILDFGNLDRHEKDSTILNFLKDSSFSQVNKFALERFKNTKDIEMSIANAFEYIKHYFPNIQIPEIYFYVSGFNSSIIIKPEFIAIATDMYLGSDYPRYSDITYEYLIYNMRPESIPVDVISSILFSNIPSNLSQNRLIDNMLYRGKIIYILSVFMPDVNPYDLFGYTKYQWEWCRKYERETWNLMLSQNHLYSTDMMLIRKYLNDAPFTTPISQDSPGRLGTWIGWQIIDSYMRKNKNLSLLDLVNENDYQKILDNSDYNP